VFGITPISRGSFYSTILPETSFTCHHVTHIIESLLRLSAKTLIFTCETKFIVTYTINFVWVLGQRAFGALWVLG
jgi:hypothetical protein